MREIKFRAWDIQLKRMYDNYANVSGYGVHCEIARPVDDNEEQHIIMQYTGLKDKNGKEIYEGDILSDGLSPPRIVVEWAYYGWRPFTQTTLQGQDLEVIGNIYENPELLKSKE